MTDRYPTETLSEDEDDGVMPANVATLAEAVIGHRIVKAEHADVPHPWLEGRKTRAFVITLDDGTQVQLRETSDCCAYTELDAFLLHPEKVDHVIMGVGTTEGYTRWHIYADWGDVLELTVGWSCGNPFYYGYGFAIDVVPMKEES